MFPTRVLVAVDGYSETSPAARTAAELAGGTGSELHVVHVVPTAPELPYLRLAASEGVEDYSEWRRLTGLGMLEGRVAQIVGELGGSVTASY